MPLERIHLLYVRHVVSILHKHYSKEFSQRDKTSFLLVTTRGGSLEDRIPYSTTFAWLSPTNKPIRHAKLTEVFVRIHRVRYTAWLNSSMHYVCCTLSAGAGDTFLARKRICERSVRCVRPVSGHPVAYVAVIS